MHYFANWNYTVDKCTGKFLCAAGSVCFRVVSVGGDGMFAEVVNGMLMSSLSAGGVEHPTIDTVLPRPRWRVGIIPAGTTAHSHVFV